MKAQDVKRNYEDMRQVRVFFTLQNGTPISSGTVSRIRTRVFGDLSAPRVYLVSLYHGGLLDMSTQ